MHRLAAERVIAEGGIGDALSQNQDKTTRARAGFDSPLCRNLTTGRRCSRFPRPLPFRLAEPKSMSTRPASRCYVSPSQINANFATRDDGRQASTCRSGIGKRSNPVESASLVPFRRSRREEATHLILMGFCSVSACGLSCVCFLIGILHSRSNERAVKDGVRPRAPSARQTTLEDPVSERLRPRRKERYI